MSHPKYGRCDVVEHSDKECSKCKGPPYLAPISHGFVNLYRNNKMVAWCGVNYAKKYLI